MPAWTRENIRHLRALVKQGRNPAATVYESIGADVFLSPAPGWLNLGFWEGPGTADEAPHAPVRLVERLAAELPTSGTILDVANGLGAQDPVIARVAEPRRLVALNITEMQLRAGRARLREADAQPLVADATRIPVARDTVDGLISVEAAFHFPSRHRFFVEAHRVLRAGGVLSMSDVSVEAMPRTPREVVAGLANLRFWGLRRESAMSADEIARAVRAAGFVDVRIERVGDRTVDPAVRFFRARVAEWDAPKLQRFAAEKMLDQWELMRRRGLIEYLLLRAVAR